MATPARPKLTLHIAGRRITADRLKRALDAFLELLNEVADEVTKGQGKQIEWVVSAKAGSIDMGYEPESKKHSISVIPVVNAIYTGVHELAQKKSARPLFFTDKALERAKDLSRLQDGKAISNLQVRRSHNRTTIGDRVAENVDRLLGPVFYETGSIEGRLQLLSSRGGLHVGVWDSLTDRAVRCNVSTELLGQAYKSFEKRVAVHGRIRYRQTGEAVSVDVESIEEFPASSELPSADSVCGILAER